MGLGSLNKIPCHLSLSRARARLTARMHDIRGSTGPSLYREWVALSTGALFPSRINHSLSLSLSLFVEGDVGLYDERRWVLLMMLDTAEKVGFIEKTALRHRRRG